jgi:pimeloyl-[acyl-carrier protein] methyl ester esterase
MHKWLWIHGWGMHQQVWEQVTCSLPSWHHVFVSYKDCNQQQSFIKSVEEQLAAYPQDDFTLVGWSMGGLLAIQTALSGNSRIKRLVLVSSTTAFCNEAPSMGWPKRIVQRMKQALEKDSDTVLRNFKERMFSPPEVKQGWMELFHLRKGGDMSIAGMMAGLDLLMDINLTSQLKEVHLPILLIHGELDSVCPVGQSKRMESLFPNAKAVYLKNTGHIPFLTKYEHFLLELRDFHYETSNG